MRKPQIMNGWVLLVLLCMVMNRVSAQAVDSIGNFKLNIHELVKIEAGVDDKNFSMGESKRTALLIPGLQNNDIEVSVKLTEYKEGEKVKEINIFNKIPLAGEEELYTFEDVSMLFGLYRKPDKDNKYTWGFRIPASYHVQEVQLLHKESDYTFIGVPQNYLNNKIPVGVTFPLLVITLPDEKGNFPFFKQENKHKYSPKEWNKAFKLKHTFVVELLIAKEKMM